MIDSKSIKQIINCIDMTITNNIMFDTMKRKVKIAIWTFDVEFQLCHKMVKILSFFTPEREKNDAN